MAKPKNPDNPEISHDSPVPDDEADRLEALLDYAILDTAPEEGFDRITRIASRILDVPMCLVSLVDTDRQWFKSKQGLDADQTPRNVAFCAHAIMEDQVMVVPDATKDARFRDNPLVRGEPNVRFYAGAPLRSWSGHNVGTLCVIDQNPRKPTPEQQEILADLAKVVVDEMELRLWGKRALDALRLKDQAVDELDTAKRNLEEEVEERKLAEAEITDKENRTRAILDTVLDGIITIDESGDIETFNPVASMIFGYRADEIIGQNVKILMPEPYRSGHDGYLRSYIKTGDAKVIGNVREVVGQRKDGTTFPMELAVAPMMVSERMMFTGVARDITERKKIDDLKNEFVSTVSHELRTPLTSIKGALGLLQGGLTVALPEKATRMIEIAYQNSDRLVRLINDILDIEKIEAGMMKYELVPVSVADLLAEAIDANTGFADEHGVRLVLGDDVSHATVSADHDRIMQVLTNLLSNAIKYSPKAGKVVVLAVEEADRIHVSVTDKGPGIPEEFRDTIFAKFAQADSSDTRERGGTGLGLAISKAIVEQHGGEIGFETQTGQGTTFHFDLPLRKAHTDAPAAAVKPDGKALSGPRILVCEDDHDLAELIAMMIESGDFECDIVHSAQQAKSLLAERTYAAMTLDLGLPDQNGLALIRDIRENDATQELPIIIVSATSEGTAAEIHGNSLNSALEIADWLQKPIDEDVMRLALKRALRKETDHRPRILHVEDDADIVSVVSALVGEVAEVTSAATHEEARRLIHAETFDLIILDLMLPDGSGEDLLCELHRSSNYKVPVIVFSAREPSADLAYRIEATLVKSQASNEDLLEVVRAAL
ncbi:MAG: PAS domain S-box protein [Alphaproteobacteria bacterium]|nr:PAS domain S-box protein [Alphaproteobacteria bacterium]